jgi:hypothetical protein
MITRDSPLPIVRQCQLLGVARSSVYDRPRGVSEADRTLRRLIDACHRAHPYDGSRRLRDWLQGQDQQVNRKRLQRLMRQMGLMALYPKRHLSQRDPAHKVYPDRLRGSRSRPPTKSGPPISPTSPWSRGLPIRSPSSVGPRARCSPGGCPIPWRLWRGRGARGSSRLTKAASSPGRRSPVSCVPIRSRSAWTAKAAGATTSSSSAFGAASRMRRSTSRPTRVWRRHAPASASTSPSSTASAVTSHWDGKHPMRCMLNPPRNGWRPNFEDTYPTVQNSGGHF